MTEDQKKQELLWPVEVWCGSEMRRLWFSSDSLATLVMPEFESLSYVKDFKHDVMAFEKPGATRSQMLVGAWVSESGKIVCDLVEYPSQEKAVA